MTELEKLKAGRCWAAFPRFWGGLGQSRADFPPSGAGFPQVCPAFPRSRGTFPRTRTAFPQLRGTSAQVGSGLPQDDVAGATGRAGVRVCRALIIAQVDFSDEAVFIIAHIEIPIVKVIF